MTATITRDQADAAAYEALQAADGNFTHAAKAAGMARTSFKTAVARHAARLEQDGQTEGDTQPATVTEAPPVPAAEVQETAPAATGTCACGCGQPASRKFVRGHDSRLGKKLRAAYVAGELTREQVLEAAAAISDRFHGKLVKSLSRADEAAARPTRTRRAPATLKVTTRLAADELDRPGKVMDQFTVPFAVVELIVIGQKLVFVDADGNEVNAIDCR